MKHWSSINFLSVVLIPITLLFCLLAFIRRILYHFGFLKAYQANVPVIVVGNISVGGTGKTPVVIALIELLQEKGYKPGVVSRGYGMHKINSSLRPLLINQQTPVSEGGDESVMIFHRTGAPVCVDSLRANAIRHLLEQTSCNVVISDDGLQHYAMARDIELAIVDGEKRHGNGLCLPSGPLRESRSRLKTVDHILYNQSQKDSTPDHLDFSLELQNFYQVGGSQTKALDAFSGQSVYAVAGTASVDRFFNSLRVLNLSIQEQAFPDHYAFQKDDFKKMQDLPIIMTEKDAIKCHSMGLKNAWYLKVSCSLPDTFTHRLLQQLKAISDVKH